ncbi:VP1 [Tetraparvovirus sp.]|uniref:VP1 n=1 Tax=Tetraparvovirus sp. TaxID=1908804 RepID=UPI0008A9ABDF|nr:VP1 [Tetraparvovirus sp.]AOW44156.1 VP1 [Tetraparvovirus sp.]
MSAADAFRPGDPPPLETLMRKLTYNSGPEPSRRRWGLPGGFIADITVGSIYERAFAELQKYSRSLPMKVYPVKQLAEQLFTLRRSTSKLHHIMRFYVDIVRLLILVAPESIANRLRESTEAVRQFFEEPVSFQYLRSPKIPVLYDLHRSAWDTRIPSAEEIEAYFDGMLSPIPVEQHPIVEQIKAQFLNIFHPPPIAGDGVGGDGGDGIGGADSPSEPNLERPPEGRFLVPGYRYVGPGNPLDNGPPEGPVDEAAKHHDERYADMLSHGDVPYLHGHGADRLMNREIARAEEGGQLTNPVDQLVGNAIRGIWSAKETVGDLVDAQISQVLPPDPIPGTPAQPSSAVTPAPKKPRTGSPEEDLSPGIVSAEPSARAETSDTTVMAATPTGGAGGGVKVKAQWIGGTSFTDSLILTSHTRTTMLAERGNYVPVYQKGSHTDETQPVIGMKTPYSYIDVNAISAHLTPRDFQQLLDEYDEIRPKKLSIGISAIVIKDIAQSTTGTTVSDSASGGIVVFADDSYDYPYVLGHNQDTLPGHLPGEHYVLPQYGYLTRGRELEGRVNDIIAIADHKTEQYFLEHHDAQCLGAGDTWGHTYDFPDDLPFRRLSTPSQTLYARHNPIPNSRLAIMTGVNSDGKAVWKRPTGLDVGRLPLNHVPGPSLMTPTDSQLRNLTFRTPVAIGNPQTTDRYAINPLVHQPWSVRTEDSAGSYSVHNYLGGLAYTRRQHEESYDGHQEESDGTVTNPSRVVQTDTDLAAPHVGHTFFVPGHTRISGSGQETIYNPKLYQEPVFPLFPGAVWNPNPLTFDCQIWTKIPDTECHFFAQYPLLGGWGMNSPPPMIFLKLRSQPGPPTAGAHTSPKSNLNQYAIFHLHYSMEFEVKRRKRSRRHNPEKPAPFPVTPSGRMPFTLANVVGDPENGEYEVPSDQWIAQNYSHKL